MTFPLQRDDDWYRMRLALPARCPRVVIDSDAANEIDDPFALAWALLSPERLRVEAVYATPYSFAHRRSTLNPHQLRHFAQRGWEPATVVLPCFDPPAIGMERSHTAILEVFDKLGLPDSGRVLRGSTHYLASIDTPEHSEAVEHLITTALATPDDEPLYVVAIGCVTNIANALLLAPAIAERIVVVWTSGHPSHAPLPNPSFNLEQDLLATRVGDAVRGAEPR